MIFTVIGLIIDDELTVAGVVEDQVFMVDTDPGGYHQRWSSSFEADSPDQAETMAKRQLELGEQWSIT